MNSQLAQPADNAKIHFLEMEIGDIRQSLEYYGELCIEKEAEVAKELDVYYNIHRQHEIHDDILYRSDMDYPDKIIDRLNMVITYYKTYVDLYKERLRAAQIKLNNIDKQKELNNIDDKQIIDNLPKEKKITKRDIMKRNLKDSAKMNATRIESGKPGLCCACDKPLKLVKDVKYTFARSTLHSKCMYYWNQATE